MAPKVGIIIQVRLGSTRLPQKALLKVGEESLLQLLIRRIKPSGFPIVIATTDRPEDDILENVAEELNVLFFRGSQDDVLARIYGASSLFGFDVVIRLTGDNPFLDAEFVKNCINDFLTPGWENRFASSTLAKSYPLGISIEIFSQALLKEAFVHASELFEKEHVTPYIFQKSNAEVTMIHRKVPRYHYRLTVDTPEDFELCRQLIVDHHCARASVESIIEVMDAHPHLAAINSQVVHKGLKD